MKPGRELDVLVAEKVMGWTKKVPESYTQADHWIIPDLPNLSTTDWHPSINMSDAWIVVERLRGDYDFDICTRSRGIIVQLWTESNRFKIEADTAPLAICLASLKAVGIRL